MAFDIKHANNHG